MKISNVKTMMLSTEWRTLIILKVETDEGVYGVGEVRLNSSPRSLLGYLEDVLPRHVLGSDPFDTESLISKLVLQNGSGGPLPASALAAIEVACWDIKGKVLGQPVYRLLGGKVRDKVRVYANGWYRVERTPEAFYAAARQVVEKGYSALKFDPFGAGYYELDRSEERLSLALVEAVRDAIGADCDMFIEMHGRFSPATAVRIANELDRFRPSWIEEPIPPKNLRGLKRVAEKVRIPIAAGEHLNTLEEFDTLFSFDAVDIIQPDLTHFGGLELMRRVSSWANIHNLQVAPHNVGGPISTAAALHLAATVPNFMIQEYFNDFADSWINDAAHGLPEVIDGCFALPEKPGLGVELDEAFISAHPTRSAHLDLFGNDWHLRRGNSPESTS